MNTDYNNRVVTKKEFAASLERLLETKKAKQAQITAKQRPDRYWWLQGQIDLIEIQLADLRARGVNNSKSWGVYTDGN